METTVDELRALGQNGATIINVGHHAGKHEIRGAIRYRPHDLLTPDHLALPIAPELPVVLYDEHGDGHDTQKIAERLQADGFKDVRILTGGYKAWEARRRRNPRSLDGTSRPPEQTLRSPRTRPPSLGARSSLALETA